MSLEEKSQQCANNFECRFRVILSIAVVLMVAGIVAVVLFAG